MSNIFIRMKESVVADLHHLIDKKEERSPVSALNHYLRQSEQEKEKVRKLVERQHKLKEEFTREYLQAQDRADKRLDQAKIAEQAGEEELYAYAIEEQQDFQMRADRMKASREEAVKQLEVLEKKYAEMKYKLKDMHLRRMELMGRENIARANHQMNKVIDETSDKPFSKFGELERYIEGLEHKVNSAYYRNTFDSKISQLEKELKNKEKSE